MNWLRTSVFTLSAALGLGLPTLGASTSHAEPSDPAAPDFGKPMVLRDALVLPPVGRDLRTPIHRDALERIIVEGRWKRPAVGDLVASPDGAERRWEAAEADEHGTVGRPDLARGGYVLWPLESDAERVLILEARGNNLTYVNGEPRMGDLYGTGYLRLPVLLKRGDNDLLFFVTRNGSMTARLAPPDGPVRLDDRDLTLPDLLVGEVVDAWGALLVVNATTETQRGLEISAQINDGPPVATPLPSIPPLGAWKVAFRLRGPAPAAEGPVEVELSLARAAGPDAADGLHDLTIQLNATRADRLHRRTFVSAIDGSVQYFAVQPAASASSSGPASTAGSGAAPRPALFLSLHGAGVEAAGQAGSYAPKAWGHVVAPTNRRPFGFDWERWGRLDALEVLGLAREQFDTDPSRTYLSGHSMGGHGTWQLGVTYPDRFAAIAPSAGWVSLWTYMARNTAPLERTPMAQLLLRSFGPSDTLALATNLRGRGVYILHGDRDDNVPVTEARLMRQRLDELGVAYQAHEEPGAGHWWGDACVDWPPIFDLFASRVIPRPEALRRVDFATASPGVSSRAYWAEIHAQIRPLVLSRIQLDADPRARRISGTTENVARLAVDVGHWAPDAPIRVELDGQDPLEVSWPADGARVWLERSTAGGPWAVVASPDPAGKNPGRYGPFHEAFNRRPLLVYGTRGTPEENAWALARARLDAETFWYRGNGSLEVVADSDFDPDDPDGRDRSVIVYGNAETNAAWPALLGGSPVQVGRGSARVGDRSIEGADLACLFLRPRPGSDVACVGVVAGSGPAGMRLTDRMAYFVTGVSYPDWIVLGPETLSEGAGAVRGAGFFDRDWKVSPDDSLWRD